MRPPHMSDLRRVSGAVAEARDGIPSVGGQTCICTGWPGLDGS